MKLALAPTDRPCLPRGVRMITDKVRGGKVLLCPEKAIALDAIGVAILSRVDGSASFEEIVAGLAAAYDAPAEQIAGDVQRFLAGLRSRLYLAVRP
jgi:pyrroloquinoline quinone biosynthesis protein D